MSVEKDKEKRTKTKQIRATPNEFELLYALADFETGGNVSELIRRVCVAYAQELPCKLPQNESPLRKGKFKRVKDALNAVKLMEPAD